jgi:DNA-directed RNA polymerase subunit RPC12/RpoP/regulation of enolase protein 1 (concanavalin A-like superfamily)
MSEFKYACPVCGQHIKCDSAQAGTVMGCPTCFQKIIVPQAPAGEDQKLILTGTRLDDKKPATAADAAVAEAVAAGAEPPRARASKFPVLMVGLLLFLMLAAGASYYLFGSQIARWLGHWEAIDIGGVGIPGSFSRTGETWNVAGSGGDIWWLSDGFQYVCRQENGDVTLTTRVLGVGDTDPWAKAGLMIRASLAANSAYEMVLVTPTSGVAFQERPRTGSPAATILLVPAFRAPCWLRLTRQKDLFTAEYSANGKAWSALGTATNPMPANAYAGLAVTAHNNAALCEASFGPVTVKGGGREATTPAELTEEMAEAEAPPANDTNWTTTLSGRGIPDAPVAGRIHGVDFISQRAAFQGGALILRGKRGADFAAVIDFSGAPAAEIAGKVINVTTNAEKAAKVTLHWQDDIGRISKPSFDAGYALRLEFGPLANNRLPGKIYLCLPDPQKSYLMGSFDARVPQTRAQP